MLARDIAASAKDEREARLPVWAQTKMDQMRRIMAEQVALTEKMRMATNPDESTVLIHKYGESPIGLGDETIEFRTKGGVILVRAASPRDDLGERGIRIQGYDGRLLVSPSSSNTVQIETLGWFSK